MSSPAGHIELLLKACHKNSKLALQHLNKFSFTQAQLGDALSIACSSNQTELALRLLKEGATLESSEGGLRPLVTACLNANITLTTALLNGKVPVSKEQLSDGLFQTCMQHHHAQNSVERSPFETVMLQLIQSGAVLEDIQARLPDGVTLPVLPNIVNPPAPASDLSRQRNEFIQTMTQYVEDHFSTAQSSRGKLKYGLLSFLLQQLSNEPIPAKMNQISELSDIQINITDFKASPFIVANPKLMPLLEGKNSFSLNDAYNFHRSSFSRGPTKSYAFFHQVDLPYDELNLKFQVMRFLEDSRVRILNKKIPKGMHAATTKKLDDLSALIATLKKQDMFIELKDICNLKAEGQQDTLLQVLRRHRDGVKKTNITSYKAFHKQFLSKALTKQEIQDLVKASDEEHHAAQPKK